LGTSQTGRVRTSCRGWFIWDTCLGILAIPEQRPLFNRRSRPEKSGSCKFKDGGVARTMETGRQFPEGGGCACSTGRVLAALMFPANQEIQASVLSRSGSDLNEGCQFVWQLEDSALSPGHATSQSESGCSKALLSWESSIYPADPLPGSRLLMAALSDLISPVICFRSDGSKSPSGCLSASNELAAFSARLGNLSGPSSAKHASDPATVRMRFPNLAFTGYRDHNTLFL
jgi:hypothetical protein